MVDLSALVEAVGTVVEFALDLLPDAKGNADDADNAGPTPVPTNEYEQRPPTGPFEER